MPPCGIADRARIAIVTMVVAALPAASASFVTGAGRNDENSNAHPATASACPIPAASNGSSARAQTSKPEILNSADQIEIWYWKSARAIEKDASNGVWVLIEASIDGKLDEPTAKADRAKLENARDAKILDLDKSKARLLADLAKSPKGIPAPPIFKVRSDKEHWDEFRKAQRAGK
jgi:hypothetical protein